MSQKKQRPKQQPRRQPDQDPADWDPKQDVPFFARPRFVITIGVIIILAFMVVPLITIVAPGGAGRLVVAPTPNLDLLAQPTFTPVPSPTPAPTPEPAVATATAQAISATATALAPTPTPVLPGPVLPTPTVTPIQ